MACCHVILWQGLGLGERKVEEFGLISYQYSPLLLSPCRGLFSLPFFFFLPHRVAYGISVLQPGIEPVTPAFNPWTTREVPVLISAHLSSVAQSCPTLCDPMDRSMPGFPVHHQLPEFTQTHVHRVGDATQPSHPLSSPSPPANCQQVLPEGSFLIMRELLGWVLGRVLSGWGLCSGVWLGGAEEGQGGEDCKVSFKGCRRRALLCHYQPSCLPRLSPYLPALLPPAFLSMKQ